MALLIGTAPRTLIPPEYLGGYFQIEPAVQAKHTQRYWPDTNVLITRFLHDDGIVELEYFMPVGVVRDAPWLIRRVRCIKGEVHLRVTCEPAFNYGRDAHDMVIADFGATFSLPRSSACCPRVSH